MSGVPASLQFLVSLDGARACTGAYLQHKQLQQSKQAALYQICAKKSHSVIGLTHRVYLWQKLLLLVVTDVALLQQRTCTRQHYAFVLCAEGHCQAKGAL